MACPAADTTVRCPVLEVVVERIPVGPHLRLSGMIPIVARIRAAVDRPATRIELDVQHLQTITEGARLLLDAIARDLRRHGTQVVFFHPARPTRGGTRGGRPRDGLVARIRSLTR